MRYEVPEDVVRSLEVKTVYFAPSEPPTGHDVILLHVIELEYEFKIYLLAALRQINPQIPDSVLGQNGIFSESKMLSNLTKCLNLARLLDLVTPDEEADLRKFVTLRNMYAHDRGRKDLVDDDEATAILYKMKIYSNSRKALSSLNAGKGFIGCSLALREIIRRKADALRSTM